MDEKYHTRSNEMFSDKRFKVCEESQYSTVVTVQYSTVQWQYCGSTWGQCRSSHVPTLVAIAGAGGEALARGF